MRNSRAYTTQYKYLNSSLDIESNSSNKAVTYLIAFSKCDRYNNTNRDTCNSFREKETAFFIRLVG